MPSSKTYGTAGEANKAIGGVPTLHYFDWFSRGRGQVIRMLWEDAGISYTDVRYPFDEYPKAKQSLIQELNPLGKIPVIELDGKILTQSYAILRKFSRLLGKYDGHTEDEKYWVDAMCDIAIDWRTLFVAAWNKGGDDYTEHQKGSQQEYLKGLEGNLKENELSQQGPFVIGNTITYADFVIYQVCHDEGLTKDGRAGLKHFPRMAKLVDGFEARPNIKKFLDSERYLG